MEGKKVVYLGGTGGLGKTTLAKALEEENPGIVRSVNCTQALRDHLGVHSREGLHRYTPEEKLRATTEALSGIVAQTNGDTRLILIDGHYAVETEPGEFITGCYPEEAGSLIDRALLVEADPLDIQGVRRLDHGRKRGLDLGTIRKELEENAKEVARLQKNAGISAKSIPVGLHQFSTRWDLGAIMSEIDDLCPGLNRPNGGVLDTREPRVTGGRYPVIESDSIDGLVIAGAGHILEHGDRIGSRSGDAIQAYNVTYHLEGSRDRVHTLRSPHSLTYFCKELIAYFVGELKVDLLAEASKVWGKLADENGMINSNYGHHVFRAPVPESSGVRNQFEWVLKQLVHNPDSRKAIININNPGHKTDTKDFPCTIALQFYIADRKVHCIVDSRSTDIYTGLPYDMGFFSFLNELVWKCLKESVYPDLQLGDTAMRTHFTQVYEKTRRKVEQLLEEAHSGKKPKRGIVMPVASTRTYSEILEMDGRPISAENQLPNRSEAMQWIIDNAKSEQVA